jgi:hypothetical protein
VHRAGVTKGYERRLWQGGICKSSQPAAGSVAFCLTPVGCEARNFISAAQAAFPANNEAQ